MSRNPQKGGRRQGAKPLNKKLEFRQNVGRIRTLRFDPFQGSWRIPVVTDSRLDSHQNFEPDGIVHVDFRKFLTRFVPILTFRSENRTKSTKIDRKSTGHRLEIVGKSTGYSQKIDRSQREIDPKSIEIDRNRAKFAGGDPHHAGGATKGVGIGWVGGWVYRGQRPLGGSKNHLYAFPQTSLGN